MRLASATALGLSKGMSKHSPFTRSLQAALRIANWWITSRCQDLQTDLDLCDLEVVVLNIRESGGKTLAFAVEGQSDYGLAGPPLVAKS